MYTFKLSTPKFNPNNEKNVLQHNKFFSLSEINQPVNQWLAVSFIGLICFWTVLTYLTEKAQAISDNYVADRQESISPDR